MSIHTFLGYLGIRQEVYRMTTSYELDVKRLDSRITMLTSQFESRFSSISADQDILTRREKEYEQSTDGKLKESTSAINHIKSAISLANSTFNDQFNQVFEVCGLLIVI